MKSLFAFSCIEAQPAPARLLNKSIFRYDDDEVWMLVVADMETAYTLAGLFFRYVLIDQQIDAEVQRYLRALNRWVE